MAALAPPVSRPRGSGGLEDAPPRVAGLRVPREAAGSRSAPTAPRGRGLRGGRPGGRPARGAPDDGVGAAMRRRDLALASAAATTAGSCSTLAPPRPRRAPPRASSPTPPPRRPPPRRLPPRSRTTPCAARTASGASPSSSTPASAVSAVRRRRVPAQHRRVRPERAPAAPRRDVPPGHGPERARGVRVPGGCVLPGPYPLAVITSGFWWTPRHAP